DFCQNTLTRAVVLLSSGLLLSVSSAVDLIMAHFSSSRDPDEKMCLGNSSYSPTISALVLEHLCPAIQNLLNDGLRDHKLDFIIGQRRNHSWNVVEASTRIGKCSSGTLCWWHGLTLKDCVICCRSIYQGPPQPGFKNQAMLPAHQPLHEIKGIHHGPVKVGI
uniref:RUN domain-containing protein n=1 Tax=Oryzias melastigma TaxID=30732 RepID=A0A3B3B592_ORYME